MSDQLNNIILEEIRGLRTQVTEGFEETKQRLTAVETTIRPFFEQDGDKDKLEARVTSLENTKWYGLGFIGAVSLAGHWLAHKLGL